MANLGDEVRKVLMAGVGAVAVTVEKGQELIELLAQKGEITVEQGKALSAELGERMKKAYEDSGIKEAFDYQPTTEEVDRSIARMTREERDALRSRLDELDRADGQPEEGCWEDVCPCCEEEEEEEKDMDFDDESEE